MDRFIAKLMRLKYGVQAGKHSQHLRAAGRELLVTNAVMLLESRMAGLETEKITLHNKLVCELVDYEAIYRIWLKKNKIKYTAWPRIN